ncbi:MAG: HEAT repeat domain-containing protein [Deltaproteobacteria bacterium]|nr:HEAT repeat domain-containing protein [Deltaproteobacteria bacterium]
MNPVTSYDIEEERCHAKSLTLNLATVTSDELIPLLGHRSWRVRKATLNHAEGLRKRPDLIPSIIAALGEPENAGLRSACAETLIRIGEVAVPQLIRALGTSDVDIRKFVVEVLGEIGSAGVGHSLIAALDDSDENVKASVVSALAHIGDRDTVEALRARLANRTKDMQLTAYVLSALEELHAELRYEELALFFERPELARLVHPLLGRCNDQRARKRLVEAITTGAKGARYEAIRALALQYQHLDENSEFELRDLLKAAPNAITDIEKALDNPDDAITEAAVVVLGILREPAFVPRILEAVASRPFVKAAFDAIRPMGTEVVPPLLDAIDDLSIDARILALEVIESFGDPRAVAKLLSIASGIEPRAAEAAISALGKLGGPDCIDQLMNVVCNGDNDIVRQTALALAAIGIRHPSEVAGKIRAVLANGDVRPVWIIVLGLIGRSEDMDTIVAASRHRDSDVRRAAIEAFSAYHGEVDENVVVLALTDESPAVRAVAARALGHYHSERVINALMVSVNDTDALVVAETLRALGRAGGEKAATTLLDAAASSQAPVAIAALQSLFRLRPKGIMHAVERALQHVDPEVVREAIVLTMRLSVEETLPLLLPCLSHRSWHVRLAAAEALANRDLIIGEEILNKVLEDETEPLVLDALERLFTISRGRG